METNLPKRLRLNSQHADIACDMVLYAGGNDVILLLQCKSGTNKNTRIPQKQLELYNDHLQKLKKIDHFLLTTKYNHFLVNYSLNYNPVPVEDNFAPIQEADTRLIVNKEKIQDFARRNEQANFTAKTFFVQEVFCQTIEGPSFFVRSLDTIRVLVQREIKAYHSAIRHLQAIIRCLLGIRLIDYLVSALHRVFYIPHSTLHMANNSDEDSSTASNRFEQIIRAITGTHCLHLSS